MTHALFCAPSVVPTCSPADASVHASRLDPPGGVLRCNSNRSGNRPFCWRVPGGIGNASWHAIGLAVLPALLALLVLAVPNAGAQTGPTANDPAVGWTRFRGPNGTGHLESLAKQDLGLSNQPTWRAKLGGTGNGSPVIWGDSLFVQSADLESGTQFLQSFDLTTGELRWSQSYPGQPHATHAWGSLASSTPTVDATHVYFCWGSPAHTYLAAVTHAGELVWRRDLGANRFEHGFGSSPALIAGRLIFFHSQDATTEDLSPKYSRMLALDPATGNTVWETPLEKTTRVCYGVPIEVALPDGRTGIVAADTGHGIFCLAADTGRMIWEQPVVKQRAVAGALAAGGLVFASSGSGGGGNQLVAIRLQDQAEVYRISRNANYVPMPVAVGNKLFVPNDKGIISCCDLSSGEILQQQRVDQRRFPLSASLVSCGDNLLLLSDDGALCVLSADAELRLKQSIELGEPTRATPALSTSGVVIRTETQLHCFGFQR